MPQATIHPTTTSQSPTENPAKKKLPSLTINVNAPQPQATTTTTADAAAAQAQALNNAPIERSLELDSAVRLVTTARLDIFSIHDHRSRVLSSSSVGGLGQSDAAATAAVSSSPTKIKQNQWLLCTLVLSRTNLHILQHAKSGNNNTPKSQKTLSSLSSSSPSRLSSMSPRRIFGSRSGSGGGGGKSSPSSEQHKTQAPFIRVSTNINDSNASMKKAHHSMESTVVDTVPLTRLHDMPKAMCFSPRKGKHTIVLRVHPNELESLSDENKRTTIRLCFNSESEGVTFQHAIAQATHRLRDVTMTTKPGHRALWLSKQVCLVAAHGISDDPDMPDTVLSHSNQCSKENPADSMHLRHSSCGRVRVLLSTMNGVHSTTFQLRPHELELVLESDVVHRDRDPIVVYKAKFKVSAVLDDAQMVVTSSTNKHASLPLKSLVLGVMVLFSSVCALVILPIPEALLSSVGIFDDVTYLLSQRKQSRQVITDELCVQLLLAIYIWGVTIAVWKVSSACATALGIGHARQPDRPMLPCCAWRVDLVTTNAHFEPAVAVVEKETQGAIQDKQIKTEMSWGQGDEHLIGAAVQDTPDVWISAAQGNIPAAHERWQASLLWRRQLNVDDITKSKPWSFDIVKQEYEHAFIGLDLKGNLISTDTFTGIKTGVRTMAAKGVTQHDYAMHMVYLNEYYLTQRVGTTGRLLKIMDLKGVRVSDLSKDVIAYLGQANTVLQNYPELVASILLLNTPSYFSLIWRVISPLLNKCTASKIKVFSARNHAAAREHLSKLIDLSILPCKYGGTLDLDPHGCTLEREFLSFVNSRGGNIITENSSKISGANRREKSRDNSSESSRENNHEKTPI